MRFLLSLIVSLAIFKGNFAATFYGDAPEDPENYGKCILSDKITLTKGLYTIEGCLEVECHDDGSFDGVSCVNDSTDGCKSIGYVNRTANYPDCCKQKWKCTIRGKEFTYED